MRYNHIELENPPEGAWYKKGEYETVIGASTRRLSVFIFYSPFLLIWTMIAISAPVTSLLAKPFFAIGFIIGLIFCLTAFYLWRSVIMFLVGKIEIIVDNNGGKIIIGNKYFKEIKEFQWNNIDIITVNEDLISYPFSPNRKIQLIGKAKTISFGSTLTDDRKYYLMHALNKFKDNPFMTSGN